MTGLADIQMGIGAASWGRSLLWHYGRTHTEHDIRAAFDVISASPGVMIDTAELYGFGQSESYIGQFATEQEHHPPVATKCFPYPWRWTGTVLLDAVRSSLRRLNRAQIDLYQMHWPFPPVKIPQWMKALAQAAEEGLVRAVGVSNYSIQQTQLAFDTLAKYGVQLASNQVKYNLLDRTIERNGLLDLCNRLGVRIIAYSPLQLGLLTGKYTPANPPTGLRGTLYRQRLTIIQPLIQTMRDIGRAYTADGVVKTPAQVAINWCICKGTMPIPGAKNAKQARQNIGAIGWRLSTEEVAALDNMSSKTITKLERLR